MYATTLTASAIDFEAFRKNLAAVYARSATSLRARAHLSLRSRTDAYDAVQEAFLFVLENPPADTSRRSLAAALASALSRATGRASQERGHDALITGLARERIAAARSPFTPP